MGKDLKGKELGKGFSQLKNGDYCARYVDRFGKRRALYEKKLNDLRIAYTKAIYDDKVLSNSIMEDILLDDWFDRWLDIIKKNEIRDSTKNNYVKLYRNQIKDDFGQKKLSAITKLQIRKWLNDRIDEGYSERYIEGMMSLFAGILADAVQNDFLVKSPMNGIKFPKRLQTGAEKALSKQEQELFFRYAIDSHYYNAFVVQVNTGLRPGELFALEPKHIDLQKKTLAVNQTLLYVSAEGSAESHYQIGPPKTETSNRVVPINSICEKALREQICAKNVLNKKYECQNALLQNLLFTTTNNHPLNYQIYRHAIKKVVGWINNDMDADNKMREFSGHVFRHSFATRAFEAGIKPKVVQKYLGHKSLQMTMDIYTTVFADIECDEMEKLEGYTKTTYMI